MDQEILKELDKILPVVVRVHGEHHPELSQVADLYAQLKAAPTPEIAAQLREITHDFTPPEDTCPTFRKTYRDLAQLTEKLNER